MLFMKEGNKLIAQGEGELIWLEPWGRDCLRFRASPSGRMVEQDWTLLPQPEMQVLIKITPEKATIKNGKIIGEITADGQVRYLAEDGSVLLEELWIDQRVNNASVLKARNYRALSSDLFEIHLYFKAYEGERFYGMGQYPIDCLDLKGCVLELAQKNTQISIPFLVSTRGYGFIWNNPAIGRAELVKNWTGWHAEAARQIDYLVIHGEAPRDIVEKYMDLTGHPPVLPEWAAGLWQSKLRYRSQDELLEVAREYKKRGLTLSVIVIDFFHWSHQGDWRFDPKRWPDPQGMVEELRRMGIRLMVSIWPTVEVESENYKEMVKRGLLVRTDRGVPVLFTFRGFSSIFDATNPEARRYVWEKVKENYYQYGIKMFWLDEAEPELGWPGLGYDNVLPYHYDNLRYHLGNGLEVSNIYPFYYAKAFYDGMKEQGEDEIVNLIRCAWIGSQRLGVVVWSGDIPSSFQSLRKQVKAGLNMAMAGIPWWTTDIGGFYGGDPKDPKFRELIVRWFQFGVFCPILRLHGFRHPYPKDGWQSTVDELTGGPNELWSFGEEVYEVLKGLLSLRERLKPYIMEQMRIAHEEGVPVMRPLFFDFPEDETAYEVEDQYMFGSDILVAPVLWEGARTRRVYLPKGTNWRDPYTDRHHSGGGWVERPAPLEAIPVFLREGAEIPIK
ncbi:glycoside hydrolase family 31 protein [Candidatus Bipolaricaulota bacterium]|nr:glycoside hydrolase family 31 protein [Candidatus Bipolaricaulota bacterium]